MLSLFIRENQVSFVLKLFSSHQFPLRLFPLFLMQNIKYDRSRSTRLRLSVLQAGKLVLTFSGTMILMQLLSFLVHAEKSFISVYPGFIRENSYLHTAYLSVCFLLRWSPFSPNLYGKSKHCFTDCFIEKNIHVKKQTKHSSAACHPSAIPTPVLFPRIYTGKQAIPNIDKTILLRHYPLFQYPKPRKGAQPQPCAMGDYSINAS